MKRFHWEQDQIAHMKVYEGFLLQQGHPHASPLSLPRHSANSLLCCRTTSRGLAMAAQSWPDKLRARRRPFKK